MRQLNPLACFVTMFALTASFALPALAADEYTIVDQPGKHAEIRTPDGKPILRYMYDYDLSTKESTFDTAKVFAHVVGPDGQTLTKGAGGKFPHHRGIFIGWSKLKCRGKTHDLWHVRNTAQRHQSFAKNQAGADAASIQSEITWVGVDKKEVVNELRTYAASRPEDAYVQVDFTSQLTASTDDVELNGDPEHAGIQFRPSQKVAENKSAKYVFHKEGIDPKKDRDLPWVAETFTLDDRQWTVQHMSHPENPEGARWSAYRDYGRFGPFTVVDIPKGEKVTFRYRFLITPGEAPSREQLAAAYKRYTEHE